MLDSDDNWTLSTRAIDIKGYHPGGQARGVYQLRNIL